MLFQFNLLLADNNGKALSIIPENESFIYLQPSTPLETTLPDLVPDPSPLPLSLAPVISREATFGDEDLGILTTNLLSSLVPSTPIDADFDEPFQEAGYATPLAPLTPIEASFEEIF